MNYTSSEHVNANQNKFRSKRRFAQILSLRTVWPLAVCIFFSTTFLLSISDGNSQTPSSARLTDEELVHIIGQPKSDINDWPSCLKAYHEFKWRVEKQWGTIIRGLIKDRKLDKLEIEKIDFSLPDNAEYGDDPENEFFNPNGKFRANPLSQDLIDELTTVKNTRLIFNLRRWYFDSRKSLISDHGLTPSGYKTSLYVLLPNFLPSCSTSHQVWGEGSFKPDNFYVAPDNHTVVQDETGDFRLRVTIDGKQRYFLIPLYSRKDSSER